MKQKLARLMTAVLLAWGLAPAAMADVVVLKEGRTMRGLVEEEAGGPDAVKFTGATGTLTIPRSRIESIEKESLAQSYVHIGDEFNQRGDLEQALQYYDQALEADGSLEVARERIASVEEALEERDRLRREDDLLQIDRIAEDVRALIAEEDFRQAEEMLERASELEPDAQQKEQLQGLIGELYLAWAKERLDHLDRSTAEEKLNLALAAQPRNEQVMALLLSLWEDQPEKKDQTLAVFQAVLEQRPEDAVLRRKVADLLYTQGQFEQSLYHYLLLYRSDDRFADTALEERVAQNLERLHRQFARDKNFDQAIYYYQLLSEIRPNADPAVVTYYRYLQRADQLTRDDVPGRVELARFAEANALTELALQGYRAVLDLDPQNEAAREALDRFALDLVQLAQQALDQGDYITAQAFANQALREFPGAEEAELRARQIKGIAETEIARERRSQRELALEYVERGDYYFERANAFFARIFSEETRDTIIGTTPKTESRRLYRAAIDAYETALDMDPTLDDQPGLLVAENMREAQRNLRILERGAPDVGIEGFRRPRAG